MAGSHGGEAGAISNAFERLGSAAGQTRDRPSLPVRGGSLGWPLLSISSATPDSASGRRVTGLAHELTERALRDRYRTKAHMTVTAGLCSFAATINRAGSGSRRDRAGDW